MRFKYKIPKTNIERGLFTLDTNDDTMVMCALILNNRMMEVYLLYTPVVGPLIPNMVDEVEPQILICEVEAEPQTEIEYKEHYETKNEDQCEAEKVHFERDE